MTGSNEIVVNQQEMCRLLEIALKGDVIREGVAFSVVQVSAKEKSGYGGEQAFTISLAEPQGPEVPA